MILLQPSISGGYRAIRWAASALVLGLAACGGGTSSSPAESTSGTGMGSGTAVGAAGDAAPPVTTPVAAPAPLPAPGPGPTPGPGPAPAPGPVTTPIPDRPADQVSVTFAASDTDFPNPERGFFKFGSDLSSIDDGFLADTAAQGFRLILTPNDLSAWRGQALPQTYLNGLTAGFAKLRARGLKAVLRFSYNYPANETDYLDAQDASLAQVKAHIAQLAPVIQANADVVAVWQAGFIGAWGEWHTSSNGLTSAANKLAVRDSLLAALPATRQLQVRYPAELMSWFPSPPTAAQAFGAAPPLSSRIGLHNDCFLASPDDVGTYDPESTAAAARKYVQDGAGVTAFGGETCLPPQMAQARMSCADILAEGAAYKLSYLNREYYGGFFTRWQAEGCFAEVSRKMGYRIVLRSLSHSAAARRGGSMAFSLAISNEGWARTMNPRSLVLRLVPEGAVGGAGAVTVPLAGTDLRRIGGNTSITLTGNALIPATLAPGRYRVQLGAPDPAASLQSQPAYALRFANADQPALGTQWQAATGVMATGTLLTVQ